MTHILQRLWMGSVAGSDGLRISREALFIISSVASVVGLAGFVVVFRTHGRWEEWCEARGQKWIYRVLMSVITALFVGGLTVFFIAVAGHTDPNCCV